MSEIHKYTGGSECYQCKKNQGTAKIEIGSGKSTISLILCSDCMQELTHLLLSHYGEGKEGANDDNS